MPKRGMKVEHFCCGTFIRLELKAANFFHTPVIRSDFEITVAPLVISRIK